MLSKSTTSFLAFGAFFFSLLFLRNKKIPKWISPNLFFALGALFSVFMVVGMIYGGLDEISEATSEMADKNSDTMAARAVIWIEALLSIYNHPLLGNGNLDFDIDNVIYGQAHNQYLDILVLGGMLIYMVFIIQVFTLSRKIKYCKKHLLSNIVLFTMLAFSIEFLAEGNRNNYFWFSLLIVSYNLFIQEERCFVKIKMNGLL